MRLVERPGKRDVEAIFAQHVRIAEAFQQQPLIVAEIGTRMRGTLGLARRRGEILEGGDALRCEPVEHRRRLDWAEDKEASFARERQRTRLGRLAPRGEADQTRLQRIDTHPIAKGKWRLE